MYCGKQLAENSYHRFRVSSLDGTLTVDTEALNAYHAKQQFTDHYPLSQLIAQRLPDE